ncbi:MAG: HEAT repeat domain-containing protein, partial [Myxococcota bacterium]
LGDSRATGALLQLSRERDRDVRLSAVEAILAVAMAMPGDDRLSARLEWLLDDPEANVASSAFDALLVLRQPDGAAGELDLAALALRCGREDIRLRALPLLVKFGGRGKYAKLSELSARADQLLGDALDDESGGVRGEAFGTLWTWYSSRPETPLTRGAACRHADIRKRVVDELARIKDRKPGHWTDDALLALIADASAQVGRAALNVLTDSKKNKIADRKRTEIYRAALRSPRPEVRAAGCAAIPSALAKELPNELGARLVELVRDEHPQVHIAAIEAIDRLIPDSAEGFAAAFASIFYDLRARACELCGKRRDRRAIEPARELLTIPESHINRPGDDIRRRVARALADVGAHDMIPFYVAMLDDKDSTVREMGARGLANSCRPGDEQPLVDALSHGDLAVRSWVAEGLARLGDTRAVPVLAGTLRHDHKPIRVGAVMGFVALGPDGVRGILQGLDDADRDIQDLVFAVIVARDLALTRADQPPDLLLSA